MSGWRRVRLDGVAEEVRNTVAPESFGTDAVFHYSIPVFDESGDGQLEPVTEIGSSKTLLTGGEVLISKLNPRKPRVLLAEYHAVPTVCSGEFVVLRPHAIDTRFLIFLLLAESTRQELDSRVQSVTRSHQRARPGDITKMWVRVPDRSQQMRIASFLDAETARIDALIEKKRRMVTLIGEQTEARVELDLRAVADRHGETPLKHLAREVTVGIVVTPAQWYADEGVPALRGINVTPGRIRFDDLINITREGHALHPKSRLMRGDLVTVRSGQAGATAVVPTQLEGANCIDLLITRPKPGVSSAYLEAVINSDWCRKHVAKHSVGAIQSHFNVEALKALPVPLVPSDEQSTLADRVRQTRTRTECLTATLERQIDLLVEHRQALITTAVTGELNLSEAA